MSMITLRDYQRECIDSTYKWFEKNPTGNPILLLPTAAGKSVIAGAFIQEVLAYYPGQRILLLTHVKELIEQNYNKLKSLWPDAPAGIYSASFRKKEGDKQIVFAGIQSVYKKAMQLGHFDLILIDECHLVPKNTMTGMYRKFLDDITGINPKLRIIGLTATHFRLESGSLIKGEGRIFHDIAYRVPMSLLLDRGYLCPLKTTPTTARLDTSGIKKTSSGDFQKKALEQSIEQQADVTALAMQEAIERGRDYKSWLVFCVTVAHAEQVQAILNNQRISNALVHGKTPKGQRNTAILNFKAGAVRALVNVGVFTTGFDAPNIDHIICLRPTQSLALWIQMAGRGMRINDGKKHCLVSDFAGNVARHGPIDIDHDPDDTTSKGEGGEAPTRICPECEAEIHAAYTQCPECGYEFPQEDQPHDRTATDQAIMSRDLLPERIVVTDVFYSRHEKPGKPPSLRVDYYQKFRRVASEWVTLQHGGMAGSKARAWIAERYQGGDPLSIRTVDNAIAQSDRLKKPAAIYLKKIGKYPEILQYEWRAVSKENKENKAA